MTWQLALAIAGALAAAGAWLWGRWAGRKAARAENALDDEEIKEADSEAALRTATETDAQALEEARARMRGQPPPGGSEG